MIQMQQCACRFNDTFNDILAYFADFNSSLGMYDQYLALYPTSEELQRCLQDLYVDYLDYCISALRHLQRKTLCRLPKTAAPCCISSLTANRDSPKIRWVVPAQATAPRERKNRGTS